jgi:hypothetical protein
MSGDRDEHTQMVADCMNRESKLSDWERGFIDSMYNRLLKGGSLTAPMDKTLTEIWEKVT